MRLDKTARQVTIQNMNLNRMIRMSLLMLFALLQCVAPFAHAHVNGHNADHNVHIELSEALWLDDHDAATHNMSAGVHHSAVVSMPIAYRFNVHAVAQPALVSLKSLPPLCEPVALPLPITERQVLTLLPFHHPCSQAPPA